MLYARYEEGYSQKEIGKFYGLSQSRVSSIILSIKNGTANLEKKKRGVKSRLDKADLEKLKLLLENKEEKETSQIWNKWSIKKLIQENFGVDYHQNYIWKIMEKIGYSSQLPQMKDYRKDAEKESYFKSNKASEIKKSGG